MQYASLKSPVGELTVSTDGLAITGLHIEGDRYFTAIPEDWTEAPDHPLLRQAQAQLKEYFAGQRQRFSLPLALIGTTFQRQVWGALQEIPFGGTATYSGIAQDIGRPQAVRAVGTAIGRNPICLLVPCHRVLASDGGLGGYVAGFECKQALLSLENTASQAKSSTSL